MVPAQAATHACGRKSHLVLFLQRREGAHAFFQRPDAFDARRCRRQGGDAGDVEVEGGAADVGVVDEGGFAEGGVDRQGHFV